MGEGSDDDKAKRRFIMCNNHLESTLRPRPPVEGTLAGGLVSSTERGRALTRSGCPLGEGDSSPLRGKEGPS